MNGTLKDERSARLRPFILFALLTFAAYGALLNSYFLSDDFVQVGRALEGNATFIWGREAGGFFRPLFTLSYFLDAKLWGANPFGYHLTNTLLHTLASLLVYHFTLKLLSKQELSEARERGVSLIAGLLFLLHPSHTEAVSWIAGRADLLATTLCLASMLAFISFIETRRALFLTLSLFAFMLALLSKESAASLPLILFALGVYFARDESRKSALLSSFKRSAPFFVLLLLFITLRRALLGVWVGGYGAREHLNLSPVWIESRFLQASLRAFLPALPQELSTVFLKPLQSPVFITGALLLLTLLVLLLRRRRRVEPVTARRKENGLVFLLASSYVFSFLPVMSLRLSIFDTQGERFVYWPSVFTSILLASLALILVRNVKWWLAAMLCVLVFYSISLYRTNQIWREAASLARSMKDELARSASTDKSVIVINAPDNLRGVPVFHNGLEDALKFFQKEKRVGEVRVLALHDIQTRGDLVEFKRENNAFTLRLLNSKDGFTKISDGPDCLKVLEHDNYSARFQITACANNPDIFIFNAGRVYRVLDGAE